MIRWWVVLRTEAVVPKYLKRYSMQVNMPEQKIRCLNLNRVSALASKYSTNDRRANRYLSGAESIIHIATVIAECFGKIV